MKLPSKSEVAELRKQYPEGIRVVLVKMDDKYTHLQAGDGGNVLFVDDIGSVHIRWDNGEGLAAVWNEDIIRKEEQT